MQHHRVAGGWPKRHNGGLGRLGYVVADQGGAMFEQKIDYIHNNPVTAGLCEFPEQYLFSSARYYNDGIDEWKMLKHYNF